MFAIQSESILGTLWSVGSYMTLYTHPWQTIANNTIYEGLLATVYPELVNRQIHTAHFRIYIRET